MDTNILGYLFVLTILLSLPQQSFLILFKTPQKFVIKLDLVFELSLEASQPTD
jgi:hypothetical protein